jgi:hypothetical protein
MQQDPNISLGYLKRVGKRHQEANRYLDGRKTPSRLWSRAHVLAGDAADGAYSILNNEYLAGAVGLVWGLAKALPAAAIVGVAVGAFSPFLAGFFGVTFFANGGASILALGAAGVTCALSGLGECKTCFMDAYNTSSSEVKQKLGDNIARRGKALAPEKSPQPVAEAFKNLRKQGKEPKELNPPPPPFEQQDNHGYVEALNASRLLEKNPQQPLTKTR